MSLSNLAIKIVGILALVIGGALILTAVGIPLLGVGVGHFLWNLIIGVALIVFGLYLIRGDKITL